MLKHTLLVTALFACNVDVVLRNTTGATINYAGGINLFITVVTDL